MELYLIISWILLTVVVAILGSSREIGSLLAGVVAFLFSPVVGLLFVFNSRKKDVLAYEKAMLDKQNRVIELLSQINTGTLNPINYDDI
mgnify:CR=1 FL=1